MKLEKELKKEFFKFTLNKIAPLKQKVVRNDDHQPLLLECIRKLLFKKISSIRKETFKIGLTISANLIIAQIF